MTRSHRRRARQRRGRQVGAVAAIGILAVAAVAAASDAAALLRDDSDPKPIIAAPIAPVAGSPATVRLFSAGDSVGLTVTEGLARLGAPLGDTVTGGAFLGCGIQPAGETFFRPERLDVTPNGCPDWQHRWPTLTGFLHADVVVFLGGSWDMVDRYVMGHWVAFGSPESDAQISGLLDTLIDGNASSGAAVALLTMPYQTNVGSDVRVPVYRSGFDPPRVDHWNALLRAAAARHPAAAKIVDLNGFASPGGYTDVLDGVAPFRGDGVHFTDAGADLVARWLLPRLDDVAKLAAPRDA